MLIKLTSKCSMMCAHWMEDAQPTGLMMTLDSWVLSGDYSSVAT